MAYATDIFVGKVLSNSGSSVGSSVLNGMNWAVTNRCQAISMSLEADIDQESPAFQAVGQRALAAGCLIVAAAGNGARRRAVPPYFGFVEQPANSPSILAVAALDESLRVADFSARSSTATGEAGKVDIAALGVRVFSSFPVGRGRHAQSDGTSMATPHVAGIAALWGQATGKTGAALWAALVQAARRIPGDARNIGAGLAQAPQRRPPGGRPDMLTGDAGGGCDMARAVVVTVDDAHLAMIDEVADRLRREGMAVDGVLEATGLITGSVDRPLAGLRQVVGVASVEEQPPFQLPPPDAPVQ